MSRNGIGPNRICQFKLVLLGMYGLFVYLFICLFQYSKRRIAFHSVLIGESAVGKSSLVLRFVKGQFHEYQESTIGGKYT